MPINTTHRLAWTIVAVFGLGLVEPEFATAQDANLKPVTVTSTRNMRFCEILIAKTTGIDVYNTTGVSNCPPDLWNAMDLQSVAKEYGAMKVEKNGPHYWMMDEQTFAAGDKVTIAGIQARWVARLSLDIFKTAAKGIAPYTVFTPKKTQKMIYAKGKLVYQIVDPSGYVYVLQAREDQFPIDSLGTLGDKLKLPANWRFRTEVLSNDLVLDLGPGATIYAIGDDYHQYWTRIP